MAVIVITLHSSSTCSTSVSFSISFFSSIIIGTNKIRNVTNCWLVWFVLMPPSTIFQLYGSGQFYWLEETGVPKENHQPITGQ